MRSSMKQGIARGWGAACFLLLPVLLLGSCMLQSDPRAAVSPGPTPQQARTELHDVLAQTQDLTGGDWSDQDDDAPRSCTVQWGLAGVSYAALRISASTGSLESVARAWERWGYDVERTTVGPVSQLVARASGELLIFRESDRGMTLQGESACRPAE